MNRENFENDAWHITAAFKLKRNFLSRNLGSSSSSSGQLKRDITLAPKIVLSPSKIGKCSERHEPFGRPTFGGHTVSTVHWR